MKCFQNEWNFTPMVHSMLLRRTDPTPNTHACTLTWVPLTASITWRMLHPLVLCLEPNSSTVVVRKAPISGMPGNRCTLAGPINMHKRCGFSFQMLFFLEWRNEAWQNCGWQCYPRGSLHFPQRTPWRVEYKYKYKIQNITGGEARNPSHFPHPPLMTILVIITRVKPYTSRIKFQKASAIYNRRIVFFSTRRNPRKWKTECPVNHSVWSSLQGLLLPSSYAEFLLRLWISQALGLLVLQVSYLLKSYNFFKNSDRVRRVQVSS